MADTPYAMTHTILPIISAVITNPEGQILLVRKSGTRWFMQAGGKPEAGETPEQTLQRELQEEIGVTVLPKDLHPLGTFSAPAANEKQTLLHATLFHLQTTQIPVIAAEIAEALWVSPQQAEHLPLAPLTRDHVLPLAKALLLKEPEPPPPSIPAA